MLQKTCRGSARAYPSWYDGWYQAWMMDEIYAHQMIRVPTKEHLKQIESHILFNHARHESTEGYKNTSQPHCPTQVLIPREN
jgi:hypothetical protein